MASGTDRRKMRCETGRCCCPGDHKVRCCKAGARAKWRKEVEEEIMESSRTAEEAHC